MSQRKHVFDILEKNGKLDYKPVTTPIDPNVKLVAGQRELYEIQRDIDD